MLVFAQPPSQHCPNVIKMFCVCWELVQLSFFSLNLPLIHHVVYWELVQLSCFSLHLLLIQHDCTCSTETSGLQKSPTCGKGYPVSGVRYITVSAEFSSSENSNKKGCLISLFIGHILPLPSCLAGEVFYKVRVIFFLNTKLSHRTIR